MKKYELTTECITFLGFLGRRLFRIKALVAFGNVEAGELGGYIEKEENLDQDGNAWVYGDAKVYGNAKVYGDAKVYGNAKVCGNAELYGNAKVCENAWVCENAELCGDAWVYGNAKVYGEAKVYGNAKVYGEAKVCGEAEVCENAWVCENADYTTAKGFGSCYRNTTFFRTKGKEVAVKCGCFLGTLAEFRLRVKETHGESKTAKEYLMLADLMEYRFSEEDGVTDMEEMSNDILG